MNDQPRFCELCGRGLELTTSAAYLWWECPKWPDRGEHWWSPRVQGQHTRLRIPDGVDLVPKRFDRYTGKRVSA